MPKRGQIPNACTCLKLLVLLCCILSTKLVMLIAIYLLTANFHDFRTNQNFIIRLHWLSMWDWKWNYFILNMVNERIPALIQPSLLSNMWSVSCWYLATHISRAYTCTDYIHEDVKRKIKIGSLRSTGVLKRHCISTQSCLVMIYKSCFKVIGYLLKEYQKVLHVVAILFFCMAASTTVGYPRIHMMPVGRDRPVHFTWLGKYMFVKVSILILVTLALSLPMMWQWNFLWTWAS